jgi:glycosyltransferase involved in cell wall biosynthesis
VRFADFVRDVRPLYAAADVLVQASTLEGVAQTIVQAIAAGVPVIATDVDGVREVASGTPHVSILPPDGRGLLETVNRSLAACPVVPAPQELVAEWLPASVDADLCAFHDWLKDHTLRRRRRSGTTRRRLSSLAPVLGSEKQVAR